MCCGILHTHLSVYPVHISPRALFVALPSARSAYRYKKGRSPLGPLKSEGETSNYNTMSSLNILSLLDNKHINAFFDNPSRAQSGIIAGSVAIVSLCAAYSLGVNDIIENKGKNDDPPLTPNPVFHFCFLSLAG